jgi:hypothetical protein
VAAALWGGGWLLLPAMAAAQGAPAAGRFVPNGAEVADTLTGLVWRRCSEGQSWTGSTCSGSAGSYTWQEALGRAKAAGLPWRLPDVKELASLVDDSRVDPAIDSAAFPGTPSTWYWTSTNCAGDARSAWDVSFGNDYASSNSFRSNRYAVRLVRAGQ